MPISQPSTAAARMIQTRDTCVDPKTQSSFDLGTVDRTITVVLGVVVAATTTVEHFLSSGQRWRHFRGSVELMKSEGWLYLQLAGPYGSYSTLEAAFPDFVVRVETLMRHEVREYVSTIIAEQRPAPKSPSIDDQVRVTQ